MRKNTSLKQRILHPGNLALHGIERSANHRRSHLLSAKFAQLPDLKKIVKGITFGDSDQSSTLPSRQLVRADAQYAQYFSSKISFHGFRFATPQLGLRLVSRQRSDLTIRLLFTLIMGRGNANIK